MQPYLDRLRHILASECEGLDAIYEDYIVKLIGEEGFELLRCEKILTVCGSVNGRTLYVLS